jgi:transcriptional regulator with XRE-family HTH domain
MSKAEEYREFIESIRSGLGYWKSYSLLQFTVSLTRIMRGDKISGKKLASQLGVSPAQVSKVLSGQENVTIETMAKFADALDAVVHIHVAKRGVQVQWLELPTETQAEPVMKMEPRAAKNGSVVEFKTSAAYTRRTKLQGQGETSINMGTSRALEENYG